MNPYGAYGMHTSFLEYGVPNEYLLEALANQYDHQAIVSHNNERRSRSPPKHRHDGTSPLPLGMDWSPPPRNWDGRDTVWPHEPRTGWSYCVTIPSWTILSNPGGAGSVVFYRVQVGIQTPEAITTTRGILHRFSDFLNLFSELKKFFPKKNVPVPPSRKLLGTKSKSVTEERRSSLEEWIQKLLWDIDISRSAPVAIFLELEAAVRSSFNDSSGEGVGSFVEGQPGSDAAAIANSSSVVSDNADDGSFRKSENVIPRHGDHAEDKSLQSNVRATSFHEDGKILVSEDEDCKVTAQLPKLSIDSAGSDAISRRNSDISILGTSGPHGEGGLDFRGGADGPTNEDLHLPSNLVMALPSEQRHKFSRFLVAMEQRLSTAKADMEDLVTRLDQELAVRQFLTTKVTDLEVELETTRQSATCSLEQAISTEKERSTQMQWDIEEFRKKCLELEVKLKAEQDEKARILSEKLEVAQENEVLKLELQAAKNLQKQHEEAESKSKTDVKVLVKEVKTLRCSQSELKQELSNVTKEKHEVERDLQNEKQLKEQATAVNEKLLHECVILQQRLHECSVNYRVEGENKLILDTSTLSEAVDLLSTSDNRIGLLLAEAQLLAQDVENAITPEGRTTLDQLRKMITDLFVDNATLRKQINATIRCTLKPQDSMTEDDEN